jgi:hypothetical protein
VSVLLSSKAEEWGSFSRFLGNLREEDQGCPVDPIKLSRIIGALEASMKVSRQGNLNQDHRNRPTRGDPFAWSVRAFQARS